MYPRIKTIIAEARLESGGGCDNSSGGGSSPVSSGASESDGSSSADEFIHHDLGEFRRPASPLSSVCGDDVDRDSIRQDFASSARDLDDIHKHQQGMPFLLSSFAAPAVAAARAEALSYWLTGFDVGWVLDMEASGESLSLPRRELERRVSAWAQALSTMERVFRIQHRELTTPAQVTALGELAVASAGAMLKPVGALAGLGSSPSKLLNALDLYAPVSKTYPVLASLFSWGRSHPVPSAAEATLAALVDTVLRCCREDLRAFIRSHYRWRMPKGGELHPCIGFWMGYFLRMLRNRVSLHLILGDEDGNAEAQGAEGGRPSLIEELISCLEAVLEEKSAVLAFPGLRQVFMLNNTHAIMCRAVGSDLGVFLGPEWTHVRLERIEGCIRGYMDASWTPVVSHLDGGGGRKQSVVSRRRNPLSAFYSAFENTCSMQRCWKVPDPELRGVLRKIVLESIIPQYRQYLEDHPEVEVECGHTTGELEQQLRNLFEG